MSKLARSLGKARVRISLPFLSYEWQINDVLDSKDVDERIARLGEIKRELEGAIDAVTSLQKEANTRKQEVDNLSVAIDCLQQDKQAAEQILKIPKESVARIISEANSKGRIRGIIEGVILGLITGIISSALVWYFTSS
jgi:tetrahydromethanopterin S-methyltransferase subunit A